MIVWYALSEHELAECKAMDHAPLRPLVQVTMTGVWNEVDAEFTHIAETFRKRSDASIILAVRRRKPRHRVGRHSEHDDDEAKDKNQQPNSKRSAKMIFCGSLQARQRNKRRLKGVNERMCFLTRLRFAYELQDCYAHEMNISFDALFNKSKDVSMNELVQNEMFSSRQEHTVYFV